MKTDASGRQRSIIVLSGGLDSVANLVHCHQVDLPVLALTFDYGQKAVHQEVRAARRFCEKYNVPHQVIEFSWLAGLGASALTRPDLEVPRLNRGGLDEISTVLRTAKSVWVPNRNGLFIETAACFAEHYGASQIIVGFNAEEAVTFPDNSQDFVQAMNRSLFFSTSTRVKVKSYTIDMCKLEIVKQLKLADAAFPFDWIWSCYLDGNAPCKECESCRRFFRAVTDGVGTV